MLLQLVCAANTERIHKGIVCAYSERIIVVNHDLYRHAHMYIMAFHTVRHFQHDCSKKKKTRDTNHQLLTGMGSPQHNSHTKQ